MRLLEPGCNHLRSDLIIFHIAFDLAFEILPDHCLVFADGHVPGEADRASCISDTKGHARITAQIFDFLVPAQRGDDERAIVCQQIPHRGQVGTPIRVQCADHPDTVFTQKLPGPIGKRACHRSPSFSFISVTNHHAAGAWIRFSPLKLAQGLPISSAPLALVQAVPGSSSTENPPGGEHFSRGVMHMLPPFG
jgi:hypothetical protein